MIREKNLFDRERLRFADAAGINLDLVAEVMMEKAEELGVEIAFYKDQVKFGGPLSLTLDNCLVVHHPVHINDYYNFVIRVSSQGKYGFLCVEKTGTSKMGHKLNLKDKGYRKEICRGESLAFKITYSATAAVVSMGANRRLFEDEMDWYAMVQDVFEAITS